MAEIKLAAEPRTEFGKGAARRIRRDNKIPAVLYGHGTDPVHVTLPGHESMLALRQTNVVRMLAYSGIAHAGFMLAPFVVAGSNPFRSMQSIVVYLVIYAAMNLGAFACIIAMARQTRSAELKDLAGVVRSMPGLAWCMVLFLASLIGMPHAPVRSEMSGADVRPEPIGGSRPFLPAVAPLDEPRRAPRRVRRPACAVAERSR